MHAVSYMIPLVHQNDKPVEVVQTQMEMFIYVGPMAKGEISYVTMKETSTWKG